jgi:hypothetical protein
LTALSELTIQFYGIFSHFIESKRKTDNESTAEPSDSGCSFSPDPALANQDDRVSRGLSGWHLGVDPVRPREPSVLGAQGTAPIKKQGLASLLL